VKIAAKIALKKAMCSSMAKKRQSNICNFVSSKQLISGFTAKVAQINTECLGVDESVVH